MVKLVSGDERLEQLEKVQHVISQPKAQIVCRGDKTKDGLL